MRARWLKPEFFTDKKIADAGPIAALVYEALWVIADDGGTAKGDAETLKSQVFFRWGAVGVPDISTAFWHLSQTGRIRRYRVGDDEYSQIVNWKRHQQVHKPGKFRHPSIEKGVLIDASESVDASIDKGVTRNSAGIVPEFSPESAAPGTHSGTSAAPLPASPPPRLLDTQIPKQPPPLAREAADFGLDDATELLAQRLVSPADVVALHALVDLVPNPTTWLAEITASLDAMPGHTHTTSEQAGTAIRDFVGNGATKDPNLRQFRRYLAQAAELPAPSALPSNGVLRTPRAPRDLGGARNDAAIDAWLADKERARADSETVETVEPEPEEIPHGE